MDKTTKNKIESIISKMTLREKLSFASGDDMWHTPSLEKKGVPRMMMCDGPHGLRKVSKDAEGKSYTVKATCFVPASALANSWNRELCAKMGKYIAEECKAEDVSVILGPGVNIKRSPLCGRNFEYFSEDPYLSGELATALIKGIQGEGVGACVKHFCCNNQETRRFSTSAEVSERALHEIYLPSFEKAIKEGKVSSIMHSYNRVNGEYAGERKELLTDLVRKKWGFKGIIMSDWCACSDRVAAYKAGTDLEMPPSGGSREQQLYEAYKKGMLTMEEIDESVRRMLTFIFSHLPDGKKHYVDFDEHHRAAASIAEECLVLLKNQGRLLPFSKKKPVAVIGGFAKKPRYQGGGSSHIQVTRLDDITDYLSGINGMPVDYAPGYTEDHKYDEALEKEAVDLAVKCGRAVIFAGMPDSFETEGRDRRHMDLPYAHNHLISAVARACKNTVVVLFGGSPAVLPWIGDVRGVIHAYLSGQALGSAVAKIIFGDVNPSGKLAETHPLRLEDTPSYGNFPGDGDRCVYGEDIYVGYRWYDKRRMEVLFPFGYGLSYTTFEYTGIETDGKKVSVRVKNTGRRKGKETVQLYVHACPNRQTDKFISNSSFGFERPENELRAFEKIELAPGEEKTVEFDLYDRMFSVWDTDLGDFRRIGGDYEIRVGSSSRDLPLSCKVSVEDDKSKKPVITMNTVKEDLVLDGRIPEEVARKALLEMESPKNVENIKTGPVDFTNPGICEGKDRTLRMMYKGVNGKKGVKNTDRVLRYLKSEIKKSGK